jgi:hypothetical protein
MLRCSRFVITIGFKGKKKVGCLKLYSVLKVINTRKQQNNKQEIIKIYKNKKTHKKMLVSKKSTKEKLDKQKTTTQRLSKRTLTHKLTFESKESCKQNTGRRKKLQQKTFKNINMEKKLLFELKYDIDMDTKLCFGLLPSKNFIPYIRIMQSEQRIGITKDIWKFFKEHTNFIQIRLSSSFLPSIEEPLDVSHDEKYNFLFKTNQNGRTVFVVKQNKLRYVELTAETWEKIMKAEVLISSILQWTTFSAEHIRHFYYNTYIPKCAEMDVDCLTEDSIYIPTDLKPDYTLLLRELSLVVNRKKLAKDIEKFKSVNIF